MTTGIVDGAFAKEFDDAVQHVKSKEEDRYMSYQMDLLGRELDSKKRTLEVVATRMIQMKKSIEEIQETTLFPVERIRELAAQIGKTGIQTA